MRVSNAIQAYEVNGDEVKGLPEPEDAVTVHSHWLRENLVVLRIGGESRTVKASELQSAIQNATNWKHGL